MELCAAAGKRDYVALAYSLTKVNNKLVLNGALLGWDYAKLNANGWMAIAVPKPGETDMVGANAIISRPLAGGKAASNACVAGCSPAAVHHATALEQANISRLVMTCARFTCALVAPHALPDPSHPKHTHYTTRPGPEQSPTAMTVPTTSMRGMSAVQYAGCKRSH